MGSMPEIIVVVTVPITAQGLSFRIQQQQQLLLLLLLLPPPPPLLLLVLLRC